MCRPVTVYVLGFVSIYTRLWVVDESVCHSIVRSLNIQVNGWQFISAIMIIAKSYSQ